MVMGALTPVRLGPPYEWLSTDPHQVAANYLAQGFTDGLCLVYTPPCCVYSFVTKLKTLKVLENVVRHKLAKEAAEGRVSGPHCSPLLLNVHSSPLGMYKIIHPLSYP